MGELAWDIKRPIEARLHRDGQLDEFRKALDVCLKTYGMDPEVAFRWALQEYPPKDGSEIELGPPGTIEPPEAEEPEPEPKKPPPEQQKAAKSDFRAATAPAREIVEWVFNNWALDDLSPHDAPCPGAWFLVQQMRKNKTLVNEFYKTVWPKLLPTKTQLDELLDRMRDDGREQADLCESLLRARERAGLASSAGDDAARGDPRDPPASATGNGSSPDSTTADMAP